MFTLLQPRYEGARVLSSMEGTSLGCSKGTLQIRFFNQDPAEGLYKFKPLITRVYTG